MSDRNEIAAARLSGKAVTWLGLIVNAFLATAKLLAGILFHSQTILADGFHSASDLITDVAVLAGLKAAGKPADKDHPYGHGRITTLVAMFVGVALLTAAGWILYGGITTIRGTITPVVGFLPLILAIASIPIKEALFQLTRWVGRRCDNLAVLANAWHHRSDAFSSIAATAGLAGVAIGGSEWAFLDSLTALVLAAFLITTAIKIIRTSCEELIDQAPIAASLEGIEQAVAGTQGVQGYHAFRARKIGGKIAMDIHIQVDPDLTVRQGHDIAGAVRRKVSQADPNVIEAIVHIEPGESQPEKTLAPDLDTKS